MAGMKARDRISMAMVHGNALLALAAAVLWGGGDFSGGMAVKSAGGTMGAALRVILLSHVVSLGILLILAWVRGDAFPHGAALAWGLSAGAMAGIALACFYVALSRGAMGASAALSGLLAAAIPAAVSAGGEGSPGLVRLVGFLVAGAAIWLIAAGPNPEAKAGGEKFRLTRVMMAWTMGAVLLDTAGNLLFIAATRAGRLDVAAVLASLYPASTILLAAWTLHERPTRRQGLGMAVAAAAVVMITL